MEAGNFEKKDDGEEEHESDSEEVLTLALRRREASDDEDGEDGVRERRNRRVVVGPDRDSEGEGRPLVYEEEEEADSEVEEYEEDEEEDEGERNVLPDEAVPVLKEVFGDSDERGSVDVETQSEALTRADCEGKNQETASTEEKKEKQPYAVPTAGTFYMHDDRCREGVVARHRRNPNPTVRKLWESKDDRAWVHDKFEELNVEEEQYNKKTRGSRGQFRGHSKNSGRRSHFVRENRHRNFDENTSNRIPDKPQRIIKGRGPRRYVHAKNYADVVPSHDERPAKSSDPVANTGEARSLSATPNSRFESRRQISGSSLSSASPPFYPSGSSTQDLSASRSRDFQKGNAVRSTTAPNRLDENALMPDANVLAHGKAIVDSVEHDRHFIDQHMPPIVGKMLPNVQIQGSRSPPRFIANQSSLPKTPEMGTSVPGPKSYQFTTPPSPVHRLSSQMPVVEQHRTVQTQSNRSAPQPMRQRSGTGVQESSLSSQLPSWNSMSEVGEVESPSRLKSKSPSSGMEKSVNQGSGKGSFLYGGAQVIGPANAASVACGDQRFKNPALLPVMQLGGQHHGGLGVPAVGMAFPGYVGQPQAGFGSSEMTWLPVLTGAAGALGASYAPYLSLDGGYYSRPSAQTSSTGVSRDPSVDKTTINTSTSPERPEPVTDDLAHRQNKPRRYSEMNFRK